MKKPQPDIPTNGKMKLQLYVSGMSIKSVTAIKNIRNLCDQYLKNNFELEIIDLYKTPEAAHQNQVIFSPSLIKIFPLPRKVLIGTFSDSDQLIKSLDISIP